MREPMGGGLLVAGAARAPRVQSQKVLCCRAAKPPTLKPTCSQCCNPGRGAVAGGGERGGHPSAVDDDAAEFASVCAERDGVFDLVCVARKKAGLAGVKEQLLAASC